MKRPINRENPPVYNTGEEGQEERYDEGIELHPILSSIKGMYRPESTWEILNTRKGSAYGRVRVSSLKHIIDQPATQPPCYEVQISYSSIRPEWSDDDFGGDSDEEEDEDDTSRMLITTIKGRTDASGTRQPITVKQFVKGHLKAIRREPDAEDNMIEAWIFMDWATKYIDKDGCLHLSHAMWRRAKVGYAYREGSDGEWRRGSEDSRRGGGGANSDEGGDDDDDFY